MSLWFFSSPEDHRAGGELNMNLTNNVLSMYDNVCQCLFSDLTMFDMSVFVDHKPSCGPRYESLRIIHTKSIIPRHPQNDRLLRWSPDEKDRIGELIRALDENVLRKGGKFCRHHSNPTNITITKRSGEYVRHLNSKCLGMKYGAWNQPRRSTNILWVWSWCFRICVSFLRTGWSGWWSQIPLNFTKPLDSGCQISKGG